MPSHDSASDSLILCMARYGFVLPRNAIEWRTDGRRGHMPTLGIHSCTILATDGLLAYFVLGDNKTLLYGHLKAFVEIKVSTKTAAASRGSERFKPNPVLEALALLTAHVAASEGGE